MELRGTYYKADHDKQIVEKVYIPAEWKKAEIAFKGYKFSLGFSYKLK